MTEQDEKDQAGEDIQTSENVPEEDSTLLGEKPDEAVAGEETNGESSQDTEGDLDLWAAAMAEQEAAEDDDTPSDSGEEDLWAAAMAEQEAEAPMAADEPRRPANGAAPEPAAQSAGERVFRPLEQSGQKPESRDIDMILDIPVRLSVELGRAKVTIKQLLEMAQGSVVELDGLAGEPMDILINGYLIAQGEVVVVEDKYGIRITEIISPSERVQKLNR